MHERCVSGCRVEKCHSVATETCLNSGLITGLQKFKIVMGSLKCLSYDRCNILLDLVKIYTDIR